MYCRAWLYGSAAHATLSSLSLKNSNRNDENAGSREKPAMPTSPLSRMSVPTAYVPKEYEYVDGKGWGYWESVTYTDAKGRKRVKREFRTGDTAVPAGTGFWYLNGGDAKSINL